MRQKYYRPDGTPFESNRHDRRRRSEQSAYYDPSEYEYDSGFEPAHYRLHQHQHYLPDSCAFTLLKIVIVFALLLFLALLLYPQGIPLIPWLLSHF
ncbi:MAG: hypothetical protein ACRDHW_12835 [Ktedonobacteraceae bacterium]